jgi:ABC-2 type transport system permease protein
MSSLRRVFHLGIKELVSLRHDLVLLLFVIYAFTVAVILSVHQAVEVRNAAIAVIDEDRSQLSARIREAILPPQFQPARLIEQAEAASGLNAGRYTFVVDLPPRLEADARAGKAPVIQVNVDATAVAQAFAGVSYLRQIVREETTRLLGTAAAAAAPAASLALRVEYNPNRDPAWFLSVAELLMMVTVLSMILPAVALLREGERGTIGHLLLTPLTPAEIMAAKIGAGAVVVQLGTVASVTLVIRGLLGVPLAGSLPLFLLGTLIFQFAATAIGMLLATAVRNVPQLVLALLLVITPIIFLSGVFTPAESMPPALARAMVLSPLRYYVEASTAILFRGAGLGMVAGKFGAMLGLGSVLFVVALRRFRAHVGAAGRGV